MRRTSQAATPCVDAFATRIGIYCQLANGRYDAPRLPPLRHNDVHLWLAFQHASPHDSRLGDYGELLSEAERQRESRLHFAHDRVRFRVTRALVRCVLGGYLGVDPRACTFENNAHGRPSLTNPECRDARLTFNVSHTQDLILLGVTRGREIGVDVERVTPKRSAALAGRFFAPGEAEHVVNAPDAQRDDLFYQYWTLKESYIKARGMGLAIPLAKFGFTLSANAPQLWTDPTLGDDAKRWVFSQLRPTPAHWAAVCVERSSDPTDSPPELRLMDFANPV
jgi:4'-phosphopantetheinyl transferase